MKFKHIIAIEKQLSIVGQGTLFGEMAPPKPIRWYDPFLVWKTSTPLFIMRMHLILMGIGIILLGVSLGV